jgi:hypothetical protein
MGRYGTPAPAGGKAPAVLTQSKSAKEEYYREFYCYNATFLSLPAGTVGGNNAFVPSELRIDADSAFEFVKTIHRVTNPTTYAIAATNAFRLRYKDDASGRFLMKASEYSKTISGTAAAMTIPNGDMYDNCFMPFIWPRAYVIASSSTFTVEAADDSGVSNNVYMSFHGNKVRAGKAPWQRKNYRSFVPYVYPIANISSTTSVPSNPVAGTIVVGANNTVSSPIATDSDADFLIFKIVGRRTGPALVTIKDGSTDRQWMDQAMHIDNLIGNAMFPNVLPSPRFVERGSVISTSIQDLSGATNTIEMQFIGVKLFE